MFVASAIVDPDEARHRRLAALPASPCGGLRVASAPAVWGQALVAILLTATMVSCVTPGKPPAVGETKAPVAATPLSPAELDSLFADLQHYDLNGDSAAAKRVAELVVQAAKGKRAERRDLESRLLGLVSPQTSSDGKRFACRQLFLVGSARRSVPSLAPLLTDPELSDMARYALERLPGTAVDTALRNVLPQTTGLVKAGIVNSLGKRQDRRAIPLLAPLVADPDAVVAEAAIRALGLTGGPEAATALTKALATASAERQPAVAEALIAAAAPMAGERESKTHRRQALGIYQRLWQAEHPESVRAAALVGIAGIERDGALAHVLGALHHASPRLREAAAAAARALPGTQTTPALVAGLGSLGPEGQALLIQVLADRGDRAALPAVLAASASPEVRVQLAALRALGDLGDGSVVSRLAEAAAADDKDVQSAARKSLDRLAAADVDHTILAAIAAAPPPVKSELVRALGSRWVREAVPTLLTAAQDPEASVRAESIKALGIVAGVQDLGPALKLLLALTEDGDRNAVSRIVVSLAKSIPEQDHRGDEVVAALRQTPDAQARCVLLSILGRIGSAATLPVLRDQLGAQEIEVRKAAVRALADWPEPTPLPDLFELAKASPDGAIRVLALRGYARQLALPSDRPIAETLAKFEQGLALAPNDAEKRLFLSGLAEIRHPRALEFVRPYIDQPALREEALVAVTRLMQALDEGTLQATASHGAGAAKNAFDGDRGTRWTSGGPQQKGQWFELDLGFPVEVQSITLDAGDTGDDYPRGYEVYLANTPGEWGEPAAQGVGKAKTTEIAVTPPREARYIRIAQTGSTTGMYWSICELAVNGQARAGRGPNTPAPRDGWVASASVKTEEAALVLDGDRDTRWGTWGPQSPGQWLMVDLAKELNVRRVIVDAAKSTKDIPAGYEVYVTSDTQDWGLPVAKGRGEEPLLSVPLLPKRGRYVKIIQTGTTDNWWWSVYELNVVAE